ncbi:MAG: FIST C-terminal domain-containing protein, partial [Gammaproteobacteria bacterium]|nr:FIST C-terminal domain-containing protein [Gammaproteobacteria bacterium]
LNYRPALEVYKDAIQAHCGEALRARPFFEMAKGFPFGIETLDAEMLVRDPVVASENGMTCVGEVPENAIVYVLQGVLDELLAAARDATASCGPDGASDLLLFDCISRRLYMNDGFEREMASINAGLTEGTNLVGALSLGEIANSSSGSIQFHNKAVVVGAAGRAPSATVTRQLQV